MVPHTTASPAPSEQARDRGEMGDDYRDLVLLPDPVLAEDVLDYDIWRLGDGETTDPEALLFQAPYKAGQITATGIAGGIARGIAGEAATVEKLCAAARRRADFAHHGPEDLEERVGGAFRQGLQEPHVDWYHLPREASRRL